MTLQSSLTACNRLYSPPSLTSDPCICTGADVLSASMRLTGGSSRQSTRRTSWSKGAKVLPSLPTFEAATASTRAGSLPPDFPPKPEAGATTGPAKGGEANAQGVPTTTQPSMSGTARRRSDNTDVHQSIRLSSSPRHLLAEAHQSTGRSSRAIGIRASEPNLPALSMTGGGVKTIEPNALVSGATAATVRSSKPGAADVYSKAAMSTEEGTQGIAQGGYTLVLPGMHGRARI